MVSGHTFGLADTKILSHANGWRTRLFKEAWLRKKLQSTNAWTTCSLTQFFKRLSADGRPSMKAAIDVRIAWYKWSVIFSLVLKTALGNILKLQHACRTIPVFVLCGQPVVSRSRNSPSQYSSPTTFSSFPATCKPDCVSITLTRQEAIPKTICFPVAKDLPHCTPSVAHALPACLYASQANCP